MLLVFKGYFWIGHTNLVIASVVAVAAYMAISMKRFNPLWAQHFYQRCTIIGSTCTIIGGYCLNLPQLIIQYLFYLLGSAYFYLLGKRQQKDNLMVHISVKLGNDGEAEWLTFYQELTKEEKMKILDRMKKHVKAET